MNNKELFKSIYHQAKPYKIWLWGSTILALIISMLTPVRPYLLQQIIDVDFKNKDESSLFIHASYIFFLIIFESILRYVFVFSTSYFSQNIVHDLRKKVFSHLLNIHTQFFDENPIGRLTTRTINDVETINEVYSDNFFTIISDILTIVFVLGTMLYIDVKLTLISLTTLPFLYIATYIFKEKTKAVNQKLRDKIGEINAFVQEHLMGFKIVKSFNAEKTEFTKFSKINQEFTDLNIKTIWYYSWFFPVLETLISISIGLVVSYVVIYGFKQGNLSVGIITSFLMYLNLLFRPMRFIADKFNSIQMGFIACERVFTLIDTPSEEINTGQIKSGKIEGKIDFNKVSFEYLKDEPILHDLSFTIPAGQSLAIVGATGSGKTSILNVLNRFYPITSGSVLLDDKSILDYDLSFLRENIGMVLQDVYLFSGTIYENIAIDNPDVTIDSIRSMAKDLDILDFFESLPEGFNFKIKERGQSLSHGQRQILSLFRAIVKSPQILVLDEATSSIDSNTEFYIQKLINKIIKQKTTVVIAHRLSTIMACDQILVLDKGSIVGKGTHSELLMSNSYYQKYFQSIKED